MEPRRFRLAVPDAALADLNERLDLLRWPNAPKDAGWRYGTEPSYLRKLLAYWRESYDWRSEEDRINRLPQYQVEIEGQTLHFLHLPGAGEAPRPLLLLHGWPGSFLEFAEIAEPLAHPERHGGDIRDAFDVVIATLPGFPGSLPLAAPQGPRAMARLLHRLMTETLGYRRFLVHGGDVGALVASRLALDQPQALSALHLSTLPLAPWTGRGAAPLTPEETAYESLAPRHWPGEVGMAAIQTTKPQSLAFGLMDSPLGLAGWLIGALAAGADTGGNLERRFSRHQLCTWLSLYWFTGSIATGAWVFGAAARDGATALEPGQRVQVPTTYAGFAASGTPRPPRAFAERAYRIAAWREMPEGGRFPALEEPDALIRSLRACNAGL